MKRYRFRLGLALLALALAALWQVALAQGAPVEGEVRKIDKAGGKITLKHGEIKTANVDLPPMNMAFQVKDAAMLERVKVGDKVLFTADKIGGAYTITSLAPK